MPNRTTKESHAPAHFAPADTAPRRKRNIPAIVAIVILAILAVAYVAGAVTFSFIYYPGTSIAGTDVSLSTASDAAERIRDARPVYELHVEGDGLTWDYAPGNIDDLIDVDAMANEVLARNEAFIWPARLISATLGSTKDTETAVDLSVTPDFSAFSATFDEAAFDEELGAAVDALNKGRSGTFTPTGSYDADTNTFSLERAEAGRQLDRDAIVSFAKLKLAALDAQADLTELGEAAFLPLADGHTEEEIEASCNAMNELVGADASFTMGGSEVARVDGAQIAQWIALDENLTPQLDEEAINAWANSLADSLDTVGTERSYTRPDGKQVTVSGGSFGWQLDRDAIVSFAKLKLAALDAQADLTELGEAAFLPLADGHTEEEIEASCNAMNELVGADASFTMGGSEVARVDGAQIAQWIALDENLTPQLDEEAINAWANSLADSLDTVGTERSYTRPDGKQVTVSGGSFGWQVDREALAQAVHTAVSEKQTDPIEVPCTQQGDVFTASGERDWGAYIDIDISEQYARYYDADGNVLWESGVITGNPNLGQDTPTGVYYINNAARNITLIGADDPETGEPKYKTPVSFWMSFVGSAVGLHDATWQASSSFGDPNARYYAGSHGCVNLPYDKAEQLFGMIEVGTCVVSHM